MILGEDKPGRDASAVMPDTAPRVELVAVGDELLRGDVRDGVCRWLARRLVRDGFAVGAFHVLPDDEEELARRLKEISTSSEVVIVSGGLGPTRDDVTRRAAAAFFKTGLVESQEWSRVLERRLAGREAALSSVESSQCSLPRGAELLRNPLGLACGFMMEKGTKSWYFLPGVPAEMRAMFVSEVEPRLLRRYGARHLCRDYIYFVGMAESEVVLLLERHGLDEPGVGYRCLPGLIEVSVDAPRRRLLDRLSMSLEREWGADEGRFFVCAGAPLERWLVERAAGAGFAVFLVEEGTPSPPPVMEGGMLDLLLNEAASCDSLRFVHLRRGACDDPFGAEAAAALLESSAGSPSGALCAVVRTEAEEASIRVFMPGDGERTEEGIRPASMGWQRAAVLMYGMLKGLEGRME